MENVQRAQLEPTSALPKMENVQRAQLEPTSALPKTLGEFRVRTDFNVSGSGYVDEIKQAAAKLIDNIDRAVAKPDWDQRCAGEFNRLKALALTNLETAAMYAVKMATL